MSCIGLQHQGRSRPPRHVQQPDVDTRMSAADVLDALPEHAVRQVADPGIVSSNAARSVSHDLAILGPDRPLVTEGGTGDCDTSTIVADRRSVTGRRLADRRLAKSEAQFHALADNSVDVVWHFVTDPYPHLDYVSPSVEPTLGYPPSWLVADFDRLLELLDGESRRLIAAALAGKRLPTRFDFTFRHSDGSTVVAETVTSEVAGGLQGVSRDVTDLRRLQATLADQALRDPLTGLANRRLFNELFAAHLARTQRNVSGLAVAYLDLDELKQVNDTHGHNAGDIVLRETARRLREVLRTADIIARLGGDEFVVVFEHDSNNPPALIERIDEALGAPVEIAAGVFVSCPPSIGVASTATVGYDPAMLLARADAAMYAMKRSRRRLRTGDRARLIT